MVTQAVDVYSSSPLQMPFSNELDKTTKENLAHVSGRVPTIRQTHAA